VMYGALCYPCRIYPFDSMANTTKTTDILAPTTRMSPTTVKLWGTYVRNIDLDWKTLADFQGTDLSLSECLEVIRRAPNLTTFTAESIKDQDDPFLPTPPSVILNESFEYLAVERHSQGGMGRPCAFFPEAPAVLYPLSNSSPEHWEFRSIFWMGSYDVRSYRCHR